MNTTPLGFLARLEAELPRTSYKEWYDEEEDLTHCSLQVKDRHFRYSEYGEIEDLTQLRTQLLNSILKDLLRQ